MKRQDQPTDLSGLWVPVVTPFDNRDRVDTQSLERLCRRILSDGARGIVALGTTGEPSVLDEAEQRAVVEACAAGCDGKIGSLMVGVGTNSTRETVANLNLIDDANAAAGTSVVACTLVVVPYYTRPSQDGIISHLHAVAIESAVPVIAYNIPYRTGRALDLDHLLQLANLPNVAGIKQSVGCLDAETLELLRQRPPGFHVFSGDDAYIAPTILMGGSGAISAAANICTPSFAEMVAAALRGDVGRARELANQLLPLVAAGFAEPNPALWKAALHALGEIPTPNLRSPMQNASEPALSNLLALIANSDERRTV